MGSADVVESDVALPDGRRLHVYEQQGKGLPVLWHHGCPNVGAPPSPLFEAARELGLRFVSFDRPGYGGSSPAPGRTVASVVADAAIGLDRLGVGAVAVMSHSGGGPYALGCAALLPERVSAVLCVASPAPYDATGLDFFTGMAPAGVGSLSAAAEGRAARAAYEESAPEDDFGFTEDDEEALGGRWSWLLDVVRPALAAGPAAMIDDDVAAVAPWGCGVDEIRAATLVVHGGRDRVVPAGHGEWLASTVPGAELWLRPEDGHVTALDAAHDALRWLAGEAGSVGSPTWSMEG